MQLFARDPAGFSAVLLDLTMPGMSGEHVVPRLRALRREVPILLMSGYDRADGDGAAGHRGGERIPAQALHLVATRRAGEGARRRRVIAPFWPAQCGAAP